MVPRYSRPLDESFLFREKVMKKLVYPKEEHVKKKILLLKRQLKNALANLKMNILMKKQKKRIYVFG